MPTYPYACDSHSWANGEIATADLLNRHNRAVLGGDKLAGDVAITGVHTVCKVGGGSGPNIVYGDSRIIRVSADGQFSSGADTKYITARLYWGGSELKVHTTSYIGDIPIDFHVSMWGIVYPGASGAASAAVTLERNTGDAITALDGFDLIIEDIGSTTHLHG